MGLRNCNAAAFAPFKKFATHFLNSDFVGTEPNDAAYAVTGLNSNQQSQIILRTSAVCRKEEFQQTQIGYLMEQ